MIKLRQLILLIAYLFIGVGNTIGQTGESALKDYVKYPTYQRVVQEFYGNYSISSLAPSKEVKFEKRRSGWHVVILEYKSRKTTMVKTEMFWSLAKEKYLGLEYEILHKSKKDSSIASKFPLPYSRVYYGICPYYGYEGWDWDVIQDFQNTKGLPDSLVFALGRAFLSHGKSLLEDHSGFGDKSVQWDLPQGKNSLNPDQLRTYRSYIHQGIEQYRKLTQMDSLYPTIVGPIKYMLANEYVDAFLELSLYQNEEEALKELIGGIYDTGAKNMAVNLLNSCALNAILYTNGDNDTYPLLYAQAYLGIRTDVLVVNINMLNTSRYVDYLRGEIPGANSLKLSLSPEQYAKGTRDYLPFPLGDLSDTLDLDSALKFIKSESDNAKILLGNGSRVSYLPVRNLTLSIDSLPQSLLATIEEDNRKEMVSRLYLEYDGPYIHKDAMIMMDILNENGFDRPIYYAVTTGSKKYYGLHHYFRLEGLAYRIVPLRSAGPWTENQLITSGIMYENMMNKFDWSGIENNTMLKRMSSNYRNNFSRLARQLIKEGKNDSANAVLENCLEVMPDSLIPFDFFMTPIIEELFELNRPNKANMLVKVVSQTYAIQLEENMKQTPPFSDSFKRNANRAMDVLVRLRDIVSEADQNESNKELTRMMNYFEREFENWLQGK